MFFLSFCSHTPTKFSADNSAISSVVTSPTSSVRSKRMQPHQRPQMQAPPAASGGPLEEPKGAPRNNGHRVVSTESLDPLLHSNTTSKEETIMGQII